jgi:hypothetical protein
MQYIKWSDELQAIAQRFCGPRCHDVDAVQSTICIVALIRAYWSAAAHTLIRAYWSAAAHTLIRAYCSAAAHTLIRAYCSAAAHTSHGADFQVNSRLQANSHHFGICHSCGRVAEAS